MNDVTLSKLLRELGTAAMPHGFRTRFRDWASERTNAPEAVAEAALAHMAAYACSDLFERGRELMERWAHSQHAESAEVMRLEPRRT